MSDIRTRPCISKRRRVLSKLENEPDLTLQKLAEDCQSILSVRKDSKNIEESVIRTVPDFLPFLCNSIFLVCVFISDLFRGHNNMTLNNLMVRFQ